MISYHFVLPLHQLINYNWNKIMKDGLSNENSFIFDRNWQKINPKDQLSVSVQQAKTFLKLLIEEYHKLKKINDSSAEEVNQAKVVDRIEVFLFKYVQQKELALSVKRQLPTLQKTPYRLTLSDCLQVWRWLNEDSTSYKAKDAAYDQAMNINEFDIGSNFEAIEIKKNVDYSSKNKRIFNQLSLEEQELVLKKSLQMVHLYYHQFKIIFNHYCKFTIQNQYKRTSTFDDVWQSLEKMSINRFMLFCREFDIIKTLQFKRRTEQNPSMSKQFLMKTFKKNAHLQKYLYFESFLMALVNISIKIHQNFDPRSYMHMELLLNSLKVRYYEQFVGKLSALQIKYSPSEFYKCYKHIFDKQSIKRKKISKGPIFNNSYIGKQTQNSKVSSLEHPPLIQNQSLIMKHPNTQSRLIKSHQSVPNLLSAQYKTADNRIKKTTKTLQKRKVSVPALPSLESNRYFKPLQHNHHLNSYNKYLEAIEDSSSVFKNRITGYSNINHLRNNGFHMSQNPESLSKQAFEDLLSKKKLNIHKGFAPQQPENMEYRSLQGNLGQSVLQNFEQLRNQDRQYELKKITSLNPNKLLKKEEKRQALESLRQKIDVKENDELLNKHLLAEEAKYQESLKASTAMQSK